MKHFRAWSRRRQLLAAACALVIGIAAIPSWRVVAKETPGSAADASADAPADIPAEAPAKPPTADPLREPPRAASGTAAPAAAVP